MLFEGDRISEAQRADELIHEFFSGKIYGPFFRSRLANVPCDCMHQVRLTEADTAVEKERVIRSRLRFGDAPRRGKRQFVGFSDDEIFKCKPRVERGAYIVLGFCLSECGRAGCWERIVVFGFVARYEDVDSFD